MDTKIALIITIAVTASTVISPIFVALINNLHQRGLRKLELKHESSMTQLKIFYENKKNAFSDFLFIAGKACVDIGDPMIELDFFAKAQTALLFANPTNADSISLFIQSVANHFDKVNTEENCYALQKQLSIIATRLNAELSTLEADIDNRQSKQK
ncbi:MAG: hypothetical protein IJY81_02825 [Lachnospiraceae bacterium]|nr:hypothetical protein [Lachnospiraceae bacterium]